MYAWTVLVREELYCMYVWTVLVREELYCMYVWTVLVQEELYCIYAWKVLVREERVRLLTGIVRPFKLTVNPKDYTILHYITLH